MMYPPMIRARPVALDDDHLDGLRMAVNALFVRAEADYRDMGVDKLSAREFAEADCADALDALDRILQAFGP
jgi:hypothetical protein